MSSTGIHGGVNLEVGGPPSISILFGDTSSCCERSYSGYPGMMVTKTRLVLSSNVGVNVEVGRPPSISLLPPTLARGPPFIATWIVLTAALYFSSACKFAATYLDPPLTASCFVIFSDGCV